MSEATKVITGPNTRFSYVHVFEPASINDSNPKYSVSLIIPKSDTRTVNAIQDAIAAAYEEGKGKLKNNTGKVPALAAIHSPLKDGDVLRPDDEAYAGCYFLSANAVRRPGVVDKSCRPILDQEEFYSGCFGRASINFYVFNAGPNKGIACGLNNLQKLRDGEPLGGSRASAESDFGSFNDDDEDDFLF